MRWRTLCSDMLKEILLHEIYSMSKIHFGMFVSTTDGREFRVSIAHARTRVAVVYEMPLLNIKNLKRFIRWTVSQKSIRNAMAARILGQWNEKDSESKKAKCHLN